QTRHAEQANGEHDHSHQHLDKPCTQLTRRNRPTFESGSHHVGATHALVTLTTEVARRPADVMSSSRARVASLRAVALLHTRRRPAIEVPFMVRTVPSAAKDTKLAKLAVPCTLMFPGRGPVTAITLSPTSTVATALPRVVSENTIQPCCHPPAVVHPVPLALLQTVTRLPRRIASLRA